MSQLKKLIPTFTAIAGMIVVALTPSVQAYWTAHPQSAGFAAVIMTAIANFAPQPQKS